MTFIDDFSRYTVIYLMKEKSDVEDKLKEYVEMVKNKFGEKPKLIRSDRGGEYISGNNSNYLKSEGILVQLTAGYSPQQNGVAERKNRTLTEMSRCMLTDADLPRFLWAEAYSVANYVQNRVVTSVTGRTPFELWNDKKSDVKHLRIFGSRYFVVIPKEKRKKLDNTAIEMHLVGYDEQSKAYRCYNKSTKKVVISRDVRFDFEKLLVYDGNVNQVDLESSEDDDCLHEQEVEIQHQVNEQEVIAERIEQENEMFKEQRVSLRANKGVPPKRFIEQVFKLHGDIVEPKNFIMVIMVIIRICGKVQFRRRWTRYYKIQHGNWWTYQLIELQLAASGFLN